MTVRADDLLTSYAALFRELVPGIGGICLLDEHLAPWEQSTPAEFALARQLLAGAGWERPGAKPEPVVARARDGQVVLALPLLRSSGRLMAAVTARLPAAAAQALGDRPAAAAAQRLKPALDCLHRELASRLGRALRAGALAERTAELEWLFEFGATTGGGTGEHRTLQQLLAASTARVRAQLAALIVPDRRIQMDHAAPGAAAAPLLRDALQRMQAHLLTWTHRRQQPLVSNGAAGARGAGLPACKLLCVPVLSKSGRVIGLLAFLNPMDAPDFQARQRYLARHVGRHVSTLLEAQFDLMTGLLTRAALEERCSGLEDEADLPQRSLIYVNIDRLHVANELHGLELGDEIIVRVGQLLAPPVVPHEALVGRIASDCFAIVVQGDPREANPIAERVRAASAGIRIGPAQEPLEVSVSCGVAALVQMPKGFARALAAAEIACKAAKDRGRNRVEVYACEDDSMMRRHDDVLMVGQLRDALKHDRLELHAQPIVPLRARELPGGYELLVRMRNADGTVSAPADFLRAAQRYQLLPAIDRWVFARALQQLGAYRYLVRQTGVSFSINLSAQSIGDSAFIEQSIEQIRASGVPPASITIEITEQTAVSNLATAAELMRRMRQIGCQVALDDFGTGMNSLASLKGLPVNRIKIDGSFVRDLLTNPRSRAAVDAILALARTLKLDTVAEFVESDALVARLTRLGIDYGQGYAFGRPVPLDEVLRTLKTEESLRIRSLAADF